MEESLDIQKQYQKSLILSKACSDLGWDNQKEIGQAEILRFLSKFSKNGEFDNNLSSKLFQYLEIEEDAKITVEEFINLYIQFEEELKKNILEIKKKISDEQNSLISYQEQMYKFKDEKLNSDGFSENAKISMEIIDIEIKQKLENINEIILYLVYNSERKQLRFEYSNDIINFYEQLFEFKSISKRDNFELVLQGIDSENKEIIEIGKKDIPLEEMTSQEEYTVQITIPEIKKPEEIAAIINSKINFHWSDYQFFEEKKKISENKLRKLKEASLKVNQYLAKVNEIYVFSSKNNYNTEQTQVSKAGELPIDSDFQNYDTFSGKNINNSNNILSPKKNIPADLSPQNNNIYDNKDIKNQFGVGYEEAKSGYDNKININTKNSSRNNYKNLKGVWLIELLSLLCILLSLLNSLQRADYISAIVGIYIFTYILFADRKNFAIKSKSFWYLFLLALAAFFLDCFWLYINVDYLKPLIINAGPYDNDIKRLTFFNTGCNAIIKCCLAILMFAQYRLNY